MYIHPKLTLNKPTNPQKTKTTRSKPFKILKSETYPKPTLSKPKLTPPKKQKEPEATPKQTPNLKLTLNPKPALR